MSVTALLNTLINGQSSRIKDFMLLCPVQIRLVVCFVTLFALRVIESALPLSDAKEARLILTTIFNE